MSTNWKDISYDLILIIIDWLTKMVYSKPAQIIRCTRAGKDNFRHCNSISQSLRLSNQGSVLTSKFWCSSSSADTDWCTQTSRLNRLGLSLTVLLASSTAVITYTFSAKISIPVQINILDLFPPDLWVMANLFLPDLLRFQVQIWPLKT